MLDHSIWYLMLFGMVLHDMDRLHISIIITMVKNITYLASIVPEAHAVCANVHKKVVFLPNLMLV